ncbi:MAG: TetR/AcrR family transcriptional regulator [Alphaproteobacteria bacterium]|nr:MAG: TetR/AcrR family transcriptional regulator [Alphaproteobacteria bacterium]
MNSESKPRTQAGRSAETRDRILDAVVEIARTRGASHVTIDAVTRASGMSKGGVLHHFPSKDALLKAMIARKVERLRADCADRRGALSDRPNPTLRAILSVLTEKLDEDEGLPGAILAASAENPSLLEPVRREFEALWADIRAETGDPDAAFAIWCAMEGLRLIRVFGMSPDGPGLERRAVAAIERMIDQLPGKESDR